MKSPLPRWRYKDRCNGCFYPKCSSAKDVRSKANPTPAVIESSLGKISSSIPLDSTVFSALPGPHDQRQNKNVCGDAVCRWYPSNVHGQVGAEWHAMGRYASLKDIPDRSILNQELSDKVLGSDTCKIKYVERTEKYPLETIKTCETLQSSYGMKTVKSCCWSWGMPQKGRVDWWEHSTLHCGAWCMNMLCVEISDSE